MKLLSLERIYNKQEHNAFTDLIFYKNKWFCAFRVASSHMSYDGMIKIISSYDGKNWEDVVLIKIDKYDLRDPKFSINPKNYLVLNSGVRLEEAYDGNKLLSLTWFSIDGKNFSKEYLCENKKGSWRWSISWNENIAYSFAYGGNQKKGCLYKSNDGKIWDILKDDVFPTSNERGTESSLVFKANKAFCFLRRDGGRYNALFGTSAYPFTFWQWNDLKRYVGGPKMICINDKFYVAGRFVKNKELVTAIGILNTNNYKFEDLLILPSKADSSYPGLVYKNKMIYMSYYSSHENKSSIYFAKIEP